MLRLFRCVEIVVFLLTLTAATSDSTLRQAADHINLLVGAAVRPSLLLSEAAYSETLAREFNMVEAEDAMKWRAIRPTADVFDFHDADEIVHFAQAHGMHVRGHCLVWDHNNPAWLEQTNYTPEQLSHLLQNHITTVMKHYAGQVFAWDVVNEALNEHGEFKDSIWYNQPGIGFAHKDEAYVEQTFRWAHEADPQALLFYNDNGGEGLGQKSDAIYAMVKNFKRHHVPIDGVGLQMHIAEHEPNPADIAANIKRLTALGLQVHITELDVSLPLDSSGQVADADLRRQSAIYRDVAHACLENPGCTAIQTWGFTDKYSWIGSHSHGTQGAALPFDRGYKPKPAYDLILQEITEAKPRSRRP